MDGDVFQSSASEVARRCCPRCGTPLSGGNRACGGCGGMLPRFFFGVEETVHDLAFVGTDDEAHYTAALDQQAVPGIFRALADSYRDGRLDTEAYHERLDAMETFIGDHAADFIRFMERVRHYVAARPIEVADWAAEYEGRVLLHLMKMQLFFQEAFGRMRDDADGPEDALRAVCLAMEEAGHIDSENEYAVTRIEGGADALWSLDATLA